MGNAKRKKLSDTGRGAVGKTAIVGAKGRNTKRVRVQVVEKTDKETLQQFVMDAIEGKATVYTDDARSYDGLPVNHEIVKHSLSEYVRGDVHTNGIETLWSMLKRTHKGAFHKMSPRHLLRYVQEFAGRHNMREMDTINIMGSLVSGMNHRRLRYEDPIADNGLFDHARELSLTYRDLISA